MPVHSGHEPGHCGFCEQTISKKLCERGIK